MTEAHLTAVRAVREAADQLRLECLKAAEGAALLHIAYDQSVLDALPLDQVALMGRLNIIQ